jgi:hypothetical protein
MPKGPFLKFLLDASVRLFGASRETPLNMDLRAGSILSGDSPLSFGSLSLLCAESNHRLMFGCRNETLDLALPEPIAPGVPRDSVNQTGFPFALESAQAHPGPGSDLIFRQKRVDLKMWGELVSFYHAPISAQRKAMAMKEITFKNYVIIIVQNYVMIIVQILFQMQATARSLRL